MLRKFRTHASAGLLAGLALAACGGPNGDPSAPNSGADDLDDLRGVEEIATALTPIASVELDNGTLAVDLADGETAVIALRAVDQMITVNGYAPADDTTLDLPALAKNVKNIAVTVEAAGAATLILDFANGTFVKGGSTGAGIVADFTGGTGVFKVRGKKTADTFTVGAAVAGVVAIAFDTDAYADITVKGPTDMTFSLGAGNDVFNAANTGVAAAANYGTGGAVSDIAFTIYGGDGTDTLTGGLAADTIHGNELADLIKGGDEDDFLFGDEGDDTFDEGTADSGSDTFDGGAGKDTVTYASRNALAPVTVTVGAGVTNDGAAGEQDDILANVEVVTGTPGDDTMTAAAGGSTLNGGAGDDVLHGLAGADTLNGDAGDDTIDGGAGIDIENGGDGDDEFDAATDTEADTYDGGNGIDLLTYAGRVAAVVVVIDGTTGGGETGEGDKVKTTVENLTGGNNGDTLTGSASANVIDGGLGNDKLYGMAGDDVFPTPSVDGGDQISGGAGTDLVDYSARTDAIGAVDMLGASGALDADDAGENDDIWTDVEDLKCPESPEDLNGDPDPTAVCTVTGNDLDNTITGGIGPDVLVGGLGDDTIDGAGGADNVNCGGGSGDIAFDDGADTINASCEL